MCMHEDALSLITVGRQYIPKPLRFLPLSVVAYWLNLQHFICSLAVGQPPGIVPRSSQLAASSSRSSTETSHTSTIQIKGLGLIEPHQRFSMGAGSEAYVSIPVPGRRLRQNLQLTSATSAAPHRLPSLPQEPAPGPHASAQAHPTTQAAACVSESHSKAT